MSAKSFMVGLICGAIIGGLSVWSIGPSDTECDFQTVTQDAAISKESESGVVTSSTDRSTLHAEVEKPSVDEKSQRSTATRENVAKPWPENQRAELASEPEDESWAYYMEQTLLQFLSTHPSISQFEISRIDCGSTQCQIEVFGFAESTVPIWQQVMYEIRQQAWSEFDQTSSGSGIVDGRLLIFSTLSRETFSD